MTKPYVIHAKVKNNLLLSRIMTQFKSVNAFCVVAGFHATEIGLLLNMKRPAVDARNGEWRKIAVRLADYFYCAPEDLFTEEQRIARLRTNQAEIEMSRQQALMIADPSARLEKTDLVQRLLSHTDLNPCDHEVLHLYFNKDFDLHEIAKQKQISISGVSMRLNKALGKLKQTAKRMNAKDEYLYGVRE